MENEFDKPSWDTKTWIIGILVAIGIASTVVAARIGGTEAPPSVLMTTCSSAHVIFEQKKRCGFEDLGKLVTVEGKVIKTHTHADGDFSINVVPDEEYQYLLYYEGIRTREYLHIEFMPCERMYKDVGKTLNKVTEYLAKGETRVSITGRWAYDGVDHRGNWRDQLGNCLEGRESDSQVGWTEIHPAYTVKIL